jgi:hypothetical protein
MPENLQRKLEIERAVNLMVNFGWEKTSEQTSGARVVLTFEKILESPVFSESPESSEQ